MSAFSAVIACYARVRLSVRPWLLSFRLVIPGTLLSRLWLSRLCPWFACVVSSWLTYSWLVLTLWSRLSLFVSMEWFPVQLLFLYACIILAYYILGLFPILSDGNMSANS